MAAGVARVNDVGRLLITCPDRPGIVAAVSRFLFERGANIVHSDQHSTDPDGGAFFMRVEFTLPASSSMAAARAGVRRRGGAVPHALAPGRRRPPQAPGHLRLPRRALPAGPALAPAARRPAGEIALVVSNHPDLPGGRRASGCRSTTSR